MVCALKSVLAKQMLRDTGYSIPRTANPVSYIDIGFM